MENQIDIDEVQDVLDELDGLKADLQTSRDLFEIIFQAANKTDPSNDEAQYTYRYLHVLNTVFFERIHEENENLKELFNRLHKAIYP